MSEHATDSSITPFALSVDVEDWYNCSRELFPKVDSIKVPVPDPSVIQNTRTCMEIIESSGSKATFFVLTTICEHYPDLVREISDRGHEVGIHTYSHRLLYKMTEEEFTDDLDKSMHLMVNCGINSIEGFRAPYWSITEKSLWVLDVLKAFGFKYDSSIFPIHRGLYGIASAPTKPYFTKNGLIEMPPATIGVLGQNFPIAGGGYLRLTPEFILRKLVNRKWRQRESSVFYCHPYEMDPEDTKITGDVKGLKSFGYILQQRVGRTSNPKKLENLIRGYKFTTLSEMIKTMDFSTLPKATDI